MRSFIVPHEQVVVDTTNLRDKQRLSIRVMKKSLARTELIPRPLLLRREGEV
jgi:hypothetical protein